MARQELICVLGMHRSGTSLLTRILNLFGVSLGPGEVMTTEPVADNPRGYWEHSELTLISDAILTRFGGNWHEPPVLPRGWETAASLEDLRQRAKQLIQDQFAEVPLWGWKDPRTCLSLPFWQQLYPQMRYVICLRNPYDVAHSLAQRDGFSEEKSFSLWLTYVSSALTHSEGKPRLVVFYEDLVDDCLGELTRLADFAGITERANQAAVREAVQQFIEPTLQHHRAPIESSNTGSKVELSARALYLSLRISESDGRLEADEQIGVSTQLRDTDARLRKAAGITLGERLSTLYKRWTQ